MTESWANLSSCSIPGAQVGTATSETKGPLEAIFRGRRTSGRAGGEGGRLGSKSRDRKTKTKGWDQKEVPKIRHDNKAIGGRQEVGDFSC